MAMTKRQKTILAATQPGKAYPIEEALKILKDNSKAKFVEAIDVAVILNALRALTRETGTLLAIEGTGAFGAASLALFRFTRGTTGAGLVLGLALLAWLVVPTFVAVRRLQRADV